MDGERPLSRQHVDEGNHLQQTLCLVGASCFHWGWVFVFAPLSLLYLTSK